MLVTSFLKRNEIWTHDKRLNKIYLLDSICYIVDSLFFWWPFDRTEGTVHVLVVMGYATYITDLRQFYKRENKHCSYNLAHLLVISILLSCYL